MKQFDVTGMSCAACSAHVEKAVTGVDGVENVSVNLLTNSMNVEGNASDKAIIDAVVKAGYGATSKEEKNVETNNDEEAVNTDYINTRNRLISSICFLVPLVYISMGRVMFGAPLPDFIKENYMAIGLIQLLLNIVIIVINSKFFTTGVKGIIRKAPNMDTLVATGSGAAFIYSVGTVFVMSQMLVTGENVAAGKLVNDLYFDSSAMILTLITFGKMLEAYSKGKTTNAIKALMNLAPKKATIIKDNKEIQVMIDEVKKGDIFVVKTGESIPVDGIILEGMSAVDESLLTGESLPVDKSVGDNISAATISRSGYLKCEAVNVGEDTALSKIIKMINDASATKAPIAKIADKVSGVFVPIVMLIALITIIVWMIITGNFGYALARGISVLVISCPCALGLATPVAIMVGNGMGAKNGVLYKNSEILELAGKARIMAVDKTGTITKGEPVVTEIILNDDHTEKELIETAYSLESKSEHPLAKAVVAYAEEKNIEAKAVENFEVFAGNGIKGAINNIECVGGNINFVRTYAEVSNKMEERADEISAKGNTVVFFLKEKSIIGIIAIADVIKPDSRQAIKEIKNMGLKVVMLTGDNKYTAEAIGKMAGVDEVISELLPDEKNNAVMNLKKEGRTIMVGDGINDAPALTSADIGMAIGAGTDVAISAADIVLMKSTLMDAGIAIRLSRLILRTIHQNLFWAFIYNIIGIPLAAGVWIHITGWTLNPMFGAAAMSLSSIFVVTNALRMNFKNIKSSKNDKKINNNKKNNKDKKIKIDEITGDKKMEKIIIITGMMCEHCEATVKNALEALPEVKEVEVSHERGTAIVKLYKDISSDVLKKTVEDQNYTVNNII